MKHLGIQWAGVFFILLFFVQARAQRSGEIKLGVYQATLKTLALSYEAGLTRRAAVELRTRYEFSSRWISDSIVFEGTKYCSRILTIELGYKHYFGENNHYQYKGLSLMPLVGYYGEIQRDPEFDREYRRKWGNASPDRDQNFYVGASGLIKGRKKRWLLEGGFTFIWGIESSELPEPYGVRWNYFASLIAHVRVGYLLFIKEPPEP